MFLIKILSNIYLLAIITLWIVETWSIISTTSAQRTTPKPHWSGILYRKKRALIFPSGSHFKFTLSLGKRLLAKYPKGLNFNLEAAAYYPLPTAQNWKTGNLIKSKEIEKITSFFNKTDTIKSSSDWFNYDKNFYIPHGTWQSSLKDWTPSNTVQPSSLEKISWNSNVLNLYKPNDAFYQINAKNLNRWHFRVKRKRRELFQYFEGFSNLLSVSSVSNCILETFCKTKQFSLLSHNVLLQDILSIILSNWMLKDETNIYQKLLKSDYRACHRFLVVHNKQCSYDLQQIFLDNFL